MWFNRSKSSLQALPIFSLVMSISQQIHNYPHKFPSIFRGWEGSDTLISNDEWLWMVAQRPSTTKWKVIIQTNIWPTFATLSVMFACHPIWRGHPPSRDPWRHVKTHYRTAASILTCTQNLYNACKWDLTDYHHGVIVRNIKWPPRSKPHIDAIVFNRESVGYPLLSFPFPICYDTFLCDTIVRQWFSMPST